MVKAIARLHDYRQRVQVRWGTIALFAILITYANGFWLTVLQGVIGAIERNEPPFMRWLRDATLMLPLVVLAVVGALWIARRLVAQSKHRIVRLVVVLLLVTMICSMVSVLAAAASSLYDYRLQVKHLELMHSYGANSQPEALGLDGFGSATIVSYTTYCNLRGTLIGGSANAVAGSAVTRLEYATFSSHVRALLFDVGLVLVTNLALVLGVLLLRDDRLWGTQPMVSSHVTEVTSVISTGSVPI